MLNSVYDHRHLKRKKMTLIVCIPDRGYNEDNSGIKNGNLLGNTYDITHASNFLCCY